MPTENKDKRSKRRKRNMLAKAVKENQSFRERKINSEYKRVKLNPKDVTLNDETED